MSHQSVRDTIALIEGQIAKLTEEARSHKRTINSLCSMIGDPPPYPDIDEGADLNTGKMVTRGDEFYGKPMATVVRIVLERRQRANLGAIGVPELFKIMKEGGWPFDTKNDANAQRGIHNTLGKNPVFHKLPNGQYGLKEWYPALRGKQKAGNGDSETPKELDKPLHDELQEEAVAEQLDDVVVGKAK